MYTARVTHNSRSTNRYIEPKILLTDIQKDGNYFRNHLWVEQKLLKGFIPRNNSYTLNISFEAKEREYYTIQDFKQVTKLSLVKIRNIKKLK